MGSVHRAFRLPKTADVALATATHVDGILSITLPARPVPEATPIKISAAPTEEQEAAKAGPSESGVAAAAISPPPAPLTPSEAEEQAPAAEKVAKEEEWLAEWDTMLDDLAEMGFNDRESSRAALAKHSGSIKAAVKELVTSRVGK